MNQFKLETRLRNLPLGDIRYLRKIGSTNDEAAKWNRSGCPDLSLVVADEQTTGRGRGGHRWYTPPGKALAFSLVVHSDEGISQLIKRQETNRLNGLGALAVCRTLQTKYQLPAQIKWPNDILVNRKKLAGILPELQWVGDRIEAVILGIGINVATQSVPPAGWDAHNPHSYPATCLESALGAPVGRWDLLYSVLDTLLFWRKRLNRLEFLETWQQNLAFLDEWVQIIPTGKDDAQQMGRIVGLKKDGALQLQNESGDISCLRTGIIHPKDPPFDGYHLRPVDSFEK